MLMWIPFFQCIRPPCGPSNYQIYSSMPHPSFLWNLAKPDKHPHSYILSFIDGIELACSKVYLCSFKKSCFTMSAYVVAILPYKSIWIMLSQACKIVGKCIYRFFIYVLHSSRDTFKDVSHLFHGVSVH